MTSHLRIHTSLIFEIGLRIFLAIFFYISDDAVPFRRTIQPEEYWLYQFPRTPSYYPSRYLWRTVFGAPVIVIGIIYLWKKDIADVKQAVLGVVLSVFLTGSVTNCIKLGVGRPRPDFIARCFPDGTFNNEFRCTGNELDVIQGYKSFPSGHSSFAFSSLGFLALYVAGKLQCFSRRGRGQTWRVICVVCLLLWPVMIAVSRTADYHHHWQDVSVGSILGMCIAYMCYRQYYPAINRLNSDIPYILQPQEVETPSTPLFTNTVNDDILKIV
ncbi:phospholipid phosphatase 5-like [Ylistrum balloti]|uniref:phospholipid phosphatase 5-like n=1 Tax=Ylistrum balloti TaxID=509963 RepID=UPI00290597CC|nr:phospholipid phosphatase 5-like [Ylistrum balloti]